MASDEEKSGSSVKVYARIRKLMVWENKQLGVKWTQKEVTNFGGVRPTVYSFQRVFAPEDDNEACFDLMIKPLCERVVNGYNAIVIAYGQTGSGKTFTLLGKPKIKIVGMLTRTLLWLRNHTDITKLEVSGVEAFGHHVAKIKIYDLYEKKNKGEWIKKEGRTMMDPRSVNKVEIKSDEQVEESVIWAHGSSHFAPTGKNPESSRGHIVFIITCTVERDHNTSVSHFVVTDLAGSEGESALSGDAVKEMAAETLTARRLEAGCINTGLSDLQGMFRELSKAKKLLKTQGSGLRRCLHPFINNKTFISVIFCISPALENCTTTESTLKFATRVCKIKAVPHKVKVIKNWKKMVEKLEKGMLDQKQKLEQLSNKEEELSNKIVQVFWELETRSKGLGRAVFTAALIDGEMSDEEKMGKEGELENVEKKESFWETFLAENIPEVNEPIENDEDPVFTISPVRPVRHTSRPTFDPSVSLDNKDEFQHRPSRIKSEPTPTNLLQHHKWRESVKSRHDRALERLETLERTMITLQEITEKINDNLEEEMTAPNMATASQIAQHSKLEAVVYSEQVNRNHQRDATLVLTVSDALMLEIGKNSLNVNLYDDQNPERPSDLAHMKDVIEDHRRSVSYLRSNPLDLLCVENREGHSSPSYGQIDSGMEFEEEHRPIQFSLDGVSPIVANEKTGESFRDSGTIPNALRAVAEANHEQPSEEMIQNLEVDQKIEALELKLRTSEEMLEDMSRKKLDQAMHFAERERQMHKKIMQQANLIETMKSRMNKKTSTVPATTTWSIDYLTYLLHNLTGSE